MYLEATYDTISRLPGTVTKLIIYSWNKHLALSTSPGLTHLTLGEKFVRGITSLPVSLRYLKIGDNFKCSLPQLTHLVLGANFDRPIDFLPSTLTHLVLGPKFSQPISSLSPLLQSFKLGTKGDTSARFKHEINFLPDSLRKLKLCLNSNFNANLILPQMVTHVYIERLNFDSY